MSTYVPAAEAAATVLVGKGRELAFTRYCNYQYCMVYGKHKGDRKGSVYCPIVVQ